MEVTIYYFGVRVRDPGSVDSSLCISVCLWWERAGGG